MYMQVLKFVIVLHDAVQTKTKLIFYAKNEVKPGLFALVYQQSAHI